MNLDLATIERLKQLGLQPPSPDVAAPSVDTPYNLRANELQQQAQQLDTQAAPPPAPHGMANIARLIQAGLEGFTGGYTHGPGYAEHEAARQAQERQREQDIYGRSKELRSESERQQQLGISAVGEQRRQAQDAAQIEELKRLRGVQERELGLKEEAAKKPVIGSITAGTTQTVRDPASGKLIDTMTNPKETADKNIGNYTRADGIHMEVFQRPDATTYERPFSETRAPAGDSKEAGNYMDLRNDQGQVTGAWNPKSGKYVPVPTEAEGLRRTAVPSTTNTKIADLENSARKVTDLGTAYKPEFVGPIKGAFERSKASGILSYLPYLTTPEGYPEFAALNADLKNSVIKLITGAQMGQQEAQRILQQVPTETDKPEMWTGKYEQTKKNTEFLMQRIKELNGAGSQPVAPGAPPQQPAGTSSADRVRARLGLPPKGQ